jgi:hypothetical protein
VRLFRVELSIRRTVRAVTDDRPGPPLRQHKKRAAFAGSWRIGKTNSWPGLRRTVRIQRNHIACALLVWGRLKELARSAGRTVHQLKQGLMEDFLIQQFGKPSLTMRLA